MIDYGTTHALYQKLLQNTVLMKHVQGVFTQVPSKISPPYLHLELLSSQKGYHARTARLDYKVTLLSHYKGLKELEFLLDEVIKSLDGETLKLKGGRAHFRLEKLNLKQDPHATLRRGECVFNILIRLTQKGAQEHAELFS